MKIYKKFAYTNSLKLFAILIKIVKLFYINKNEIIFNFSKILY